MTYAECLQDRLETVMKQSFERRREFDDLLAIFIKRAEAQEVYSKTLQNLTRQAEKYAQGNTVSTLAFAAFRSDQMHRVEHSRVFSQSVRDDILAMLRDISTTQNTECKKLQKDSKKLQKDLSVFTQALIKTRGRFQESQKLLLEQNIINEIVKVSAESNKDRKEKQQVRTREMENQARQYQQTYRLALKQFNQFVGHFNSEMDKILAKYEQHERARIEKQTDAVMKLLVFESGMMKNFEYDIGNVSKQLDGSKPDPDIEQFISANSTGKKRLIPDPGVLQPNLLAKSVQKLINKQTYTRIQFQRKKQVKEFVQGCYKGTIPEVTFQEGSTQEFIQISEIVGKIWKGTQILPAELGNLSKECQSQINRYMFAIMNRYYGGMYNLQLSTQGFDNAVKVNQVVLDRCLQQKDVIVARKLMTLMFSHYTNEPPQAKSPPGKKYDLYRGLNEHPLWKMPDYWQAAILESIQQQIKMIQPQKSDTYQQIVDRQKNVIFSQLAAYCHNMVMLGLPSRTLRTIAGRYFQLYNLDEEKSQHLSDTLSYAFKQYREINNIKEVPQESNSQSRRMSS